MRVDKYFDLVRKLPVEPLNHIIGRSPFVVLSPHPDDETLGTGGLIALARSNDIEVHVVVLTDGAGSHTHSVLYPSERLVELRKSEVEKAGLILGLISDRVHYLGLPDARAPTTGPAFDNAVEHVTKLITRAKATTLFVTWQHDPHCDHVAAALMALELRRKLPTLQLWSYPIWGWHLDSQELDLPSPQGCRLNIEEQQSKKLAAIAAHASQMTSLITDDPDGFRFTQTTLAPFIGRYEYFIEVPA